LIIRGNAELSILDDLPRSLRSVGAFRGAEVYIENNPKLASLGGLGSSNTVLYANVTVQGNSPELPASEVAALKGKAVPVEPMSVDLLLHGVTGNATKQAAAAAAAPAANAPIQPAAAGNTVAGNASRGFLARPVVNGSGVAGKAAGAAPVAIASG
jgi:hypothetical protein